MLIAGSLTDDDQGFPTLPPPSPPLVLCRLVCRPDSANTHPLRPCTPGSIHQIDARRDKKDPGTPGHPITKSTRDISITTSAFTGPLPSAPAPALAASRWQRCCSSTAEAGLVSWLDVDHGRGPRPWTMTRVARRPWAVARGQSAAVTNNTSSVAQLYCCGRASRHHLCVSPSRSVVAAQASSCLSAIPHLSVPVRTRAHGPALACLHTGASETP